MSPSSLEPSLTTVWRLTSTWPFISISIPALPVCSLGHLLKLAAPLQACLLAGCLPHKTISSREEVKCCGVHSCGSRSTRKYRGNTVQRMKTGLSAPVPCCAFAPDGVTRGQLLSLPNNTGSSRAGLASSPLKHTPHEAGCRSGGSEAPQHLAQLFLWAQPPRASPDPTQPWQHHPSKRRAALAPALREGSAGGNPREGRASD